MARYFRRRKFCRFTAEGVKEIDYKDLDVLREYIARFNAGTWPPIRGMPENSDEEGIPFCP